MIIRLLSLISSKYHVTKGLELQISKLIITPPRNRGGVIFLLQFVCVCVCVCMCVCVRLCVCVSVCPALLANKIPAERMHRFERGFTKWLLPALARTQLKLVTLGNRMGDDVIVTSFKFSPNNCTYLKFY